MYCFMTDLDNTLIYSEKKLLDDRVCAEKKDGKEISFMKTSCYEKFIKLRGRIEIIPITTRSLEQYKRITLFHQEIPHLALVSNGGILLRNGEIDRDWLEETKQLVADALPQIEKAAKMLAAMREISFDIRNIDDLFLFTKSEHTEAVYGALCGELDLTKVSVYINLSKVYVLPKVLDKGLAVRRLRSQLGGARVIAAGDSIFDVPMLLEADSAIGLFEECGESLHGAAHRFLWTGDYLDFSEFVLDTADYLTRD